MKFKSRILCGALLAAAMGLGWQANLANAQLKPTQPAVKPAAVDKELEKVKADIAKAWQGTRPNIPITKVERTEMNGIYLVTIGGREQFFSSADGKNFIAGNDASLYRLAPGEIINVTEEAKNGIRADEIAKLKSDDLIVFSPKGDVKAKMYVFTDVDCGYCRLLHQKVPELNDMGIEVAYLGYPRAGINSNSYKKVASAWCSDDKLDALTKLKNMENIPTNVCDKNPVPAHYAMGQRMGISGTPAIVLESGKLIGGYMEPARLAPLLGVNVN